MAPRVPYAPPPKHGPEKLGREAYDQQMAAHRAWLASVAGDRDPQPEEPPTVRQRPLRSGDTFAYSAKVRLPNGRVRTVRVHVEARDKADAMVAARAEVRAQFPEATISEQRCNRPRGVPFQKGGDPRQVQQLATEAPGGGGGGQGDADGSADGSAEGVGDAEAEVDVDAGEGAPTPLNDDVPGDTDTDDDADDEGDEAYDDDADDEGDEAYDDDADDEGEQSGSGSSKPGSSKQGKGGQSQGESGSGKGESKGSGKGESKGGATRQQEAATLEQIAQSLKEQRQRQSQQQTPQQAEAACDLILLRKNAPPAEGPAAAALVGGIAAATLQPALLEATDRAREIATALQTVAASRPTHAEAQRFAVEAANAALQETLTQGTFTVDDASLDRAVSKAVGKVKHDEAMLGALVTKLVAEATKPIQRTVELTLTRSGATITKVVGAHVALEDVVTHVEMRKPILLIGPTGCGKTYLALQLGTVLNRRVYVQPLSGGISESALTGKYLPVTVDGKWAYIPAPLVDFFENGGIYVGDEMDGADANVLLVLNSALANGIMGLPNRHNNPVARVHPDFVFIGTANTWGTGANRLYVGRNQLDAATLDRFRVGTVELDYDRALERSLVQGPGSDEFLARMWAYRDAVNEHRLQQNVSTRFVVDAWAYLTTTRADGTPVWTLARAEQQLMCGWTASERAKAPAAKAA